MYVHVLWVGRHLSSRVLHPVMLGPSKSLPGYLSFRNIFLSEDKLPPLKLSSV